MSASEWIAKRRELLAAATEGPWEADGTEISQHWSRPEPWKPVASNEVACMAYCYGGSGRGIEREDDAEFIAAARTDVPALLAEVRRLREEARAFAEALEFGNDRTEPAATLTEMLDPIEQAFGEAWDHAECPVVCELCGERLAWQLCEKCHGSGCLSNAALAYLECDECAGAGMIHPDCAERTYAELAAEVRRLQAAVERVREMHAGEPYAQGTDYCDECEHKWPCPTIAALDGTTVLEVPND